jgi:hypothetical protein
MAAAAPQSRNASGRFKPGQSGNPGGRPAVDPKVKEALEALTLPAVTELGNCLRSPDESIRLKAATTVLERNLGKPKQPVEHSGDAAQSMGLRQLLTCLPEALSVLAENDDG